MKRLYVLFVFAALSLSCMAPAVLAQNVSDAAVLYLRVAAGARPGGMGEAFVSIADDATATYWNPAGLGNAPIAGELKTMQVPGGYDKIQDVVTIRGESENLETWVIADNTLVMFDGTKWNTGTEHTTSPDQTLEEFLQTVITINDPDRLEAFAASVRAANCPISEEDMKDFVERIRTNMPEDYPDQNELDNQLNRLEKGFYGCLLNTEQFREVRKKLNDGLKDSELEKNELDKITFSMDRVTFKFLPSKLKIPYSSGIDANLVALGSTGQYLWVGTDKGLYRKAGQAWSPFTAEDGVIPSNNILSMAYYDEYLMAGTDSGLVRYHAGSFATFDYMPKAPVTSVTLKNATEGYAIVGGMLFQYDGHGWAGYYKYRLRVDDTFDRLIERTAIYHTDEEYEYLKNKIIDLNRDLLSVNVDVAVTPEGGEAADTLPPVSEEVLLDSVETEINPEDIVLEEGVLIRLPLSPVIRFEVNAMALDFDNTLWVGTDAGLLSMQDYDWKRYGYDKYVVPTERDGQPVEEMTAAEIARMYLPGGSEDQVNSLAEIIDEYNALDGQPVEAGEDVFVYSANIGSKIHSIGMVFENVYVGTEYGLEQFTGDGWEEVATENLNRRQVISSFDQGRLAYYVSEDGITTETKGKREIVLMHVNWLPDLNLDMYYEYLSYVHHVRGLGTFGLSVIYLNYGEIPFTDEAGNPLEVENPFELTVGVSYGTSLSKQLKWGLTGKFIHSHLSTVGAGAEQGDGIASAFAVDLGVLYKITNRMQFGAAATNLGPDITYVNAAQSDPLPRNLGVGLSYRVFDSPFNSLIVQGELNTLLTDLDGGIGTELEYAIRHIGAEYVYSNLIMLRAGYKYDKGGDVKHLTFGAGLKLASARFDFAYIPSTGDSPLSNTLRISGTLGF